MHTKILSKIPSWVGLRLSGGGVLRPHDKDYFYHHFYIKVVLPFSNGGFFCSQKETEPWWARRWGVSCGLCSEHPLPGPWLCTQPRLGARGGTRWAGRAEEGTFLPVCRRAQAGAGSSGPLLIAPPPPARFRGAILAEVALCWHRWSLDVALREAGLRARVSLPEQRAGRWGRRSLHWSRCGFLPRPC